MSQFSKKLVLYLLIIAIAVFAIDSLAGQNTNKAEMSYTGFVQQVQQKKVESVTITNDHGIKGKLKNGTDFVSYAPSDDTLIKTLTDNGVEITAAPPEQPSWWVSLLGSAIPIIIFVTGCLHGIRKNIFMFTLSEPSAFRIRCTFLDRFFFFSIRAATTGGGIFGIFLLFFQRLFPMRFPVFIDFLL